jgi:hypothetical protein
VMGAAGIGAAARGVAGVGAATVANGEGAKATAALEAAAAAATGAACCGPSTAERAMRFTLISELVVGNVVTGCANMRSKSDGNQCTDLTSPSNIPAGGARRSLDPPETLSNPGLAAPPVILLRTRQAMITFRATMTTRNAHSALQSSTPRPALRCFASDDMMMMKMLVVYAGCHHVWAPRAARAREIPKAKNSAGAFVQRVVAWRAPDEWILCSTCRQSCVTF